MLFICVCPVMANSPEPAALAFLKKARDGALDLEPGGDTALQPSTSEEKRRRIRQDFERLENDLKWGELEIGDVKTDGDYAAVMVLKAGGFDSIQAQVFPVALVRQGEDWLPAPVLASFENAVSAYTLPLRDRLSKLEDWMLRKRVTDLGMIIEDSSVRMRKSIEKSVSGDFLKNGSPREIADRFVEACRKGDTPAILGFLGGLSEPLPDDWELRMRAARFAARGSANPDSPWYLVSSPMVVRKKVLEDVSEDEAMISFGCLDPRRAGLRGTLGIISVFHLALERDSAGFWRIDPQDALLNDDAEALADELDLDVDLLDKFPDVFRESTPLVGGKTLDAAEKEVVEVLRSGDLTELLAYVGFGNSGKDGRIACAEAAKLWWTVHEPGRLRVPVKLGSKEEGSLGAVAFQWFSATQPDRYERKTLFFRKQAEGWVWAPGVVTAGEREAQKVLSEWVKAGEVDWRNSWREKLMRGSVRLEDLDENNVPTDLEAKQIVSRWLESLESKKVYRAVGLCAWFGDDDDLPINALRNLSYELSTQDERAKEVGKVYRTDSWVAVQVTKVADKDRKSQNPKTRDHFIVILATQDGVRVVPELDLLEEDTRTRRILNENTFKRLEEKVGKASTKELRTLFENFLEDAVGEES